VASATTLCGAGLVPPGYLATASATPDCDDTTAGISPLAPELADDGLDNDCSGGDATHGALATAGSAFYVDLTGCAGSRLGTAVSPFCTITEGLTAIDGTTLGKGTLFIAAGLYDEVTIPITLDVVLLGGYRNQAGTWARNLATNTVRIRSTTTSTSFRVPANVQRVVLDGLSLEAPVTAPSTFALQSLGPIWLSRVQMFPAQNDVVDTIGAQLSADTTLVGGQVRNFRLKALEFAGNPNQHLRVFEATLGTLGNVAKPSTVVDFGPSTGGGVMVRSQLSATQGTTVVGVHTPHAPAETVLVGNTIDLQAAPATTWVRNDGNVIALGNVLKGYSTSIDCTGLLTSSVTSSHTTFVGNTVNVESLSTACVGLRLSTGTSEVAHNVLRVLAAGDTDGVVIDGTATTTTVLNNVFLSSIALRTSSVSRVGAWGNTFDPAVNVPVANEAVFSAASFDACAWQGCVAASGTHFAPADFVNMVSGNFALTNTSVCLNGGADPVQLGLTLIPAYAFAPNAPRPVGSGYDVGVFER
jgi:hypothetical protein